MRFGFGKNWLNYVRLVDETRVRSAVEALRDKLGGDPPGRSFLDVGCGSGLSSLAARRLGCTVFSFDYDEESVRACAQMKERFHPGDAGWRIERGDILDPEYVRGLGDFDIVYSWGVLHHTGAMKEAFDSVKGLVKPGGMLFIAIYNDQGGASRRWKKLKELYNRGNGLVRLGILGAAFAYFEGKDALYALLRGANPLPFGRWAARKKDRGMSVWHDLVDWCGGYPFEVARPEDVFRHFPRKRVCADISQNLRRRIGLQRVRIPPSTAYSRMKNGPSGLAFLPSR